MIKNKKILLLLCINLCLFFLLINRIQLVSSAAVNADIIVAKDGTGNFTTIQAAIDSVPSNSSKRTVIFVKNGTYKEVVTIRKNNIHLIGESNTKTIITYDNYAGKLKPDGTTYGTSGSASFYLYGTDTILENITIENSFDESIDVKDKQAVAAYIRGDRQIIKNCIFIGNQDTLYAHSGRQYYVNCKIIGDTDFIFGGATAVFENCEIVSTPKGGYVTAASTDLENYGFLFLNCRLTSDAPKNSTYLGRPWRPNAYVVYKTCYLGAHIKESGWTSMSGNLPENARFFEYKNTGPGAVVNSSRRQLSDAEAAKFTPQNLLKGTDNWNPVALVSQTPTLTPTQKPTSTPAPTPMDGQLIKSLTVKDSANSSNWSIQSNLRVGDTVFGDRTYKFVTIPNEFLGSEWIRTACDSKKSTEDLAYFTAKADITVYVGLDSRVATIPSWLNDWTKTSLTITDDGSPQVTYNLYKKNFSANSVVTLGPNGASSGAVNYIVIVKQNNQNIVYGDLNGDGLVNSSDYSLLKRYILKQIDLTEEKLKAADLNRNGSVDSVDYSILKRFLLKTITQLPV
ncbi:pectinesterase family protein [Acetivibrio thermocellus]|uniref:pectinesterase family protein n=1 Tax=Acetivibrio thermocellus TaxID=1515 RepID=UPI00017E2477|nr:pectinesterase family protein [Acetivibrio thermocellus]THJ76589.1 pectin esterase [Acetivibrio thermocellus]